MRVSARSASDTLLTPALRRYVAAPLLRLVPLGVTANAITLAAHACLFAAPFVAATLGQTRPAAAGSLIVVLILLFAIGDELDGMQAQRTRTTSSLGEFLDHYLDSFGPGVLLYAAYALYRLESPNLLLATIGCTFLTGASLYHEQFRTGTMVFEAVSTTESLAFAAVVLGLGMVPEAQRLARLELLPRLRRPGVVPVCDKRGGARAYRGALLRSHAGSAGSLVASCGRSHRGRRPGCGSPPRVEPVEAAVLVLYGCSNAGSLILRRLRAGRLPFPDPVAPIALLAAALARPQNAGEHPTGGAGVPGCPLCLDGGGGRGRFPW